LATNKESYLCLSAMLRARENKLLNEEKAQRMLDAANFAEAAKLLVDCGYEDMSSMNSTEINAALNAHRSAILYELDGLVPEEGIVELFRMKYDYHNAKTVIKAEAMGQEPERLMSDAGRMKPAALLDEYQEEHYSAMPGELGTAMAKAKAVLARTGNPQLADTVLDQAYFDELSAGAKKLNNAFIADYVRTLIDSTNLKIAVRILRVGLGSDAMVDTLIRGGSVETDRIIAAGDGESISALFDYGKLEKAASLVSDVIRGGSLTAFELECDNAVNAYLKGAKLMSYGMECVVAYVAAVETEITAVRMILNGFLDGIAPARTMERLRDMYA